ncbi:MAG: succinate dehydrogenase cytochrome b subunit [Flavobacteriaceae bacterium]|nr:succinate dehydrogenase cytochrome b subunit [Mangrovimonas sp.]MCB0469914.1 succinate dehydrogenase cytochrome b subunit [Flavobacteriaceae bacterium]MCB0431883.1 succinate dehydrogenase cytochrome b subunit [Mangrovimonas sp.]MCB0436228.1 succinate dehydrogenase cytochrome b subunit [Mangrovimonas sp.]MCB0439402.1 succinate dehydrogenase cytochrome b subunit [Mangrovimonas sp.]
MSGILNSSVGRKFAMALSAFFLMIFLLLHVTVNLISVFSESTFNEASHFMGTFPLIQFVMQPILIIGVVFHFVMGFVLEAKNRSSRTVKYFKNNGAANSTWMSRNMIYSGAFILIFLIIHFIDFWIPEMNYKYIEFLPEDPNRYYHELQEKFVPLWRVAMYCLGFVFLALHLLHGFMSAFQSVGANNKYTKGMKGFAKAYSIVVPALFIFIALYHHFSH